MRKWFSVCIVMFIAVGCGGPKLGEVTGIVTLDDKPLENATVTFTPADGPQSVDRTDALGRYELKYSQGNPGAVLGEHTVSIETYHIAAGGIEFPETLPEKYNRESELSREVKPGKQQFDFNLESE